MKKNLFNVLLLLIVVLFSQCKKQPIDEFETIQIYKNISTAEMRALPVGITEPISIKKTGKIYIYNDYLFINEPNKGIHIYTNANPNAPVNLAFLQIPGNADLAVRDHILYADSYVDLLAFDISNMANIKQTKRVTDVFMQYYTPMNGVKQFVTIFKDTLVKKNVTKFKNGFFPTQDLNVSFSSGNTSGQGGSMARFTLMNDNLYTVGINNLSLFNVKTASNPVFIKTVNLAIGVETIFPYENKLFIGTNNGMHIFNASDAENPVKLSTYSHVFACDPVVVQGKYAYVTLRTGNNCRQASNQLEVVDIEDPTKPKQVAVYPMQNPHGLSVNGNNLFLCEGSFGIKSFNISNKTNIGTNLLQHLKDIKSFDVIAGPKSLIVTGDNGVYQFNYTNAADLKQLSLIKVSAL